MIQRQSTGLIIFTDKIWGTGKHRSPIYFITPYLEPSLYYKAMETTNAKARPTIAGGRRTGKRIERYC
jgi:hypothetical protein